MTVVIAENSLHSRALDFYGSIGRKVKPFEKHRYQLSRKETA